MRKPVKLWAVISCLVISLLILSTLFIPMFSMRLNIGGAGAEYVNGKYFGGIYDDRLLVKITKTNSNYNLTTELPYDTAKPMYLVENVDDKEYLLHLVLNTIKGL